MIVQVLLAANKICNLEEANIDSLKKPASATDEHGFLCVGKNSEVELRIAQFPETTHAVAYPAT